MLKELECRDCSPNKDKDASVSHGGLDVPLGACPSAPALVDNDVLAQEACILCHLFLVTSDQLSVDTGPYEHLRPCILMLSLSVFAEAGRIETPRSVVVDSATNEIVPL